MAVSGNRLLAALAPEEYERLRPNLTLVQLRQGEVLHPLAEPIENVYFPIDGVLSFTISMRDGRMVEVGTVGNEGMAGLTLLYPSAFHEIQTIVQVGGGEAEAMRAGVFLAEMDRRGPLYTLMQRYITAMLSLVMQSVACNALHDVSQRGARWLLMTHDRVGSETFALTQEYLAAMLGVRRPTVTLVARQLQQRGLITYRRRRITVVDRKGLEKAACECYAVVRREFDRLTP